MSEYISEKQLWLAFRMAKRKRLGRQFQLEIENGGFDRWLESLHEERPPFEVPEGCSIYQIRAKVYPASTWDHEIKKMVQQGIICGKPLTEVGLFYPTEKIESSGREIVSLHFSHCAPKLAKAVAWGKESLLSLSDPRELFALTTRQKALEERFGTEPVCLVATKECMYDGVPHVCVLYFGNKQFVPALVRVDDYQTENVWLLQSY